jgi:biopolymer transport protein TolQ
MDIVKALIKFPLFLLAILIATAFFLLLLAAETVAIIVWLLLTFVFITRAKRDRSWFDDYPNSVTFFANIIMNLWGWAKLKNQSLYSGYLRFFSVFVILIMVIVSRIIYLNYKEILNSEIVKIILNSGYVVQVIMFLLLLSCIISYTLMLINMQKLQQASWMLKKIEESSLRQLTFIPEFSFQFGIDFILDCGFKEYTKLINMRVDKKTAIDSIKETMKHLSKQEIDRLESTLWVMATIGSISPYIGLLGTVWGIMNSFSALGTVQDDLSLAIVAPGISEALIATAMGLVAAIPSAIAYNKFATSVDRLATRCNAITDDFIGLLWRIR